MVLLQRCSQYRGVTQWFLIPDVSLTPLFLTLIFFSDTSKGEVFSYNLTSGEKQGHDWNLRTNVCEVRKKLNNIYHFSWGESKF